MNNLEKHYEPNNFSDKVALGFTKFLRFLADTFFKKRYGHRAVVLETVAAVPGMVAGMLIHLKSLRKYFYCYIRYHLFSISKNRS